jgi:hypothetical protein
VKMVTKIALIATLLASGITAASAQQNRTRAPYDPPNPGIMTAPSDNGGYGTGGLSDPSNYRGGFSGSNLYAAPGSQYEREIDNHGS